MIKNLLALSIFALPLLAYSYDFEENGICYDITSEEQRTLAVTYKTLIDGSYEGDLTVPATVIKDGLLYRVTSVGKRAFRFCHSLTSLTLPGSITEIEEYAFSNCTKLESVNMPEMLENLGSYAFESCESLSELRFFDSLLDIGNSAFYNCKSLSTIDLGNSVKIIGSQAFDGCSSLTEVSLPASVYYIASTPFSSCTSLQDINVEEGCENYYSIDGILYSRTPSAIVCCPIAKASAVVADGVKEVADYAFYSCFNLKEITLPQSLSSIGNSAFFGCRELTVVTLPDNINEIKEGAFRSCSKLTSVHLPEQLEAIPEALFWNCYSLKEFNFPRPVTSVGKNAFSFCQSLKEVIIGNKVEEIGSNAFSNCTILQNIVLSSSLKSIGFDAFTKCPVIKYVSCYPALPPEVYLTPFDEETYSTAVLYVMPEFLDIYSQTEPWNKFSEIRGELTGVKGLEAGPQATTLFYDLKGNFMGESDDTSAPALPAGVYIVKRGSQTTKVIIR